MDVSKWSATHLCIMKEVTSTTDFPSANFEFQMYTDHSEN